jgi:hypothetical protein
MAKQCCSLRQAALFKYAAARSSFNNFERDLKFNVSMTEMVLFQIARS